MFGSVFYNKAIRKMVTAFGSMFTNTTLVRYNPDGTENERFIVPLAFGGKEKFIQALEGDPNQDKNVQITLPIISFNLVNITYDPNRKLQTSVQNFQKTADGSLNTQYNPVPYNLDFEVYIYVRSIEDGTQIVEQILPYFTPNYTLKIDMMQEMGIVKDVPVILNSASYQNDNEGAANVQETRHVIWTLRFTMRGYIFGPMAEGGHVIREAITNIYNWNDLSNKVVKLVLNAGGTGTFKTGEVIYQGNNISTSAATATVDYWHTANNRLDISNAAGIFKTNVPIHGIDSNATWNVINYEIIPQIIETIDIKPNPLTANIGDPFTYTITKTFFNV